MTPSTVRLKQLAEAVIASVPDGMGGDWRVHYDYEKAANPEAVLGLIARIERFEAALQFYADENGGPYAPGDYHSVDGGKTAREALKEET